MALEYALYLETDLKPKHVLEFMFAPIGVKAEVEKSNRRGRFLSTSHPGFTISAYKTADLRRDFVTEALDIEPTLTIRFRLDIFKDRERQKQILLQTTIELLRHVKGDAVLLFNGEVVWLLRKEGVLTLNSGMELWRPDLLALVSLPYQMKDLPML